MSGKGSRSFQDVVAIFKELLPIGANLKGILIVKTSHHRGQSGYRDFTNNKCCIIKAADFTNTKKLHHPQLK